MLYDTTRHNGKKILLVSLFFSLLLLDKLDRHKQDCQGIDAAPTKTMLPDKNRNILKFENWKHKQDSPFVVYADFESILQEPPTNQNHKSTLRADILTWL